MGGLQGRAFGGVQGQEPLAFLPGSSSGPRHECAAARGGRAGAGVRPGPAGAARHRPHGGGRGDARRDRRLGQRQVVSGAHPDGAAAARCRSRAVPRHRPLRHRPGGAARGAAAAAGGVPGPVRLARPAPARRPHRRRAAARPGAGPRGAGRARALGAGGGVAAARRGDAPPARLLGRPAPAHRDRPRPGRPAGAGDRRRAGLGAGRLGAGAGAEPPAGAAGAAGGRLRVHQPRSRRDPAHGAPDRGARCRAHRRGGRRRRGAGIAAPPGDARAARGAAGPAPC